MSTTLAGQGFQAVYNQAWQCLDWDLLDGALFAAERLLAWSPSPEAKYLHALALYRLGRYASAKAATVDESHIGCVYVFAQSCLRLKTYTEGIKALESSRPWWSRAMNVQSTSTQRAAAPGPSALLLLLGKLYKATGNRAEAVQALAMSSKENAYLWENVDILCQIPGYNVKTATLFPEVAPGPAASHGPLDSRKFSGEITFMGSARDPFSTPSMPPPPIRRTTMLGGDHSTSFGSANESLDLGSLGASTAASTGIALLGPMGTAAAPHAHTPLSFARPRDITPSPAQNPMPTLPATPMRKRMNPRRALMNDLPFTPRAKLESTPRVPSGIPGPAGGSLRISSGTSGLVGGGVLNTNSPSPLIAHTYEVIATVVKLLARYDAQQALALLRDLQRDSPQRASPTVLALVARAHLQLMDFNQAAVHYEQLRASDPFRVQDMDDYSKALWLLNRQVDLGYLAHELTSTSRTSWQTWCVLGDSFSLQHDTVRALECFERALVIEPNCSVAHALQGHEFMATEEYERAQASFRAALRADSSNYNAWYGLGLVLLRLDDTEQAEVHIQQALRINPNNPILLSALGTVYEKRGDDTHALEQFKRASETAQPNNAVVRFKLAEALLMANMHNEALHELRIVQAIAPEDSSVHAFMGRAYAALKQFDLAVKHYTIAMNLDVRTTDYVKAELEALAVQEADWIAQNRAQ